MTARKPKARKPVPRKRSKTTLEQRVAELEGWMDAHHKWAAVDTRTRNSNNNVLRECVARIESLETRAQFRDASHDEPVSNAGEAVGQHFTVIAELPRAPWWKRFWNFMGAP